MNLKEKIEGKKFSKAVTEDRSGLWDQGLAFDGSTLPALIQRDILKDWLLRSDLEFKEVCKLHGLSEEEAQKLEEKLPPNLLAMRRTQNSTELALAKGKGIDKDPEVNANFCLVGLRFLNKASLMADLMFQTGNLKPKELLNLVSVWDKVVSRIEVSLTPEGEKRKDREGLKALMELTSEALGDLRQKVKEYRKYKVEIPEAEIILEDKKEE